MSGYKMSGFKSIYFKRYSVQVSELPHPDLEIEQYNTHLFYKIQYYFVLSPFFI